MSDFSLKLEYVKITLVGFIEIGSKIYPAKLLPATRLEKGSKDGILSFLLLLARGYGEKGVITSKCDDDKKSLLSLFHGFLHVTNY